MIYLIIGIVSILITIWDYQIVLSILNTNRVQNLYLFNGKIKYKHLLYSYFIFSLIPFINILIIIESIIFMKYYKINNIVYK